MPSAVFERVWHLKEILTLSALAGRHMFVSDGSYVNSRASGAMPTSRFRDAFKR